MCEVHGSRTISLGTFSCFVQQSDDAVSRIIRWRTLISARLLRAKSTTEAEASRFCAAIAVSSQVY